MIIWMCFSDLLQWRAKFTKASAAHALQDLPPTPAWSWQDHVPRKWIRWGTSLVLQGMAFLKWVALAQELFIGLTKTLKYGFSLQFLLLTPSFLLFLTESQSTLHTIWMFFPLSLAPSPLYFTDISPNKSPALLTPPLYLFLKPI